MIRRLAEKTWSASRKELRIARTVVLKLKTSIALLLRERINLSPKQRFRLVGVGLSNFHDPDDASHQPALFE